MVRILEADKVREALENGHTKAAKVIANKPNQAVLKNTFDLVVRGTHRLLDNFTLQEQFVKMGRGDEEGFFERDNHTKKIVI